MCQNTGGGVIRTTVSQSYGQLHFSPSHWQHPNKVELNYKSLHLSVACLRLQMNHSSYHDKTTDFASCRKIGNNTYKSTPNYPPIIVSAGARKFDASEPKFQKDVNKWAQIMIKTGQWGFTWTRDDAKQKHVFRFISHIRRKVETDKRYQANGLLLPSLFVT